MKKILKIIIVNIFVFTILWSFLELVCYTAYENIPSKYRNGKRIVELNLGRKVSNTEQSIISHPYLLYTNNPNHFDSIKQHNSLGYRSPEFNLKKDSNTVRVLTLGGSTTYGYLNKNPHKTWPSILQRKLQKITSKKVEVINGGLNYATSAELLSSYIFRHRYINADIVVIHTGGNDAAAQIFPNYNPEYSHFRSNGSGSHLRPKERFLLRSNVFKFFYSIWLNNTRSVYNDQPYSFSLLDKSEVSKRVANDSNYVGFTRNLDLLVKLVKLDNSEVLLMEFLHASKEKTRSTRRDLKNIAGEIIHATNKNIEIMKSISLKHNINYINLNPNLFKNEWFIDNCHLTPQGEEMKAQIAFNQMKSLLK